MPTTATLGTGWSCGHCSHNTRKDATQPLPLYVYSFIPTAVSWGSCLTQSSIEGKLLYMGAKLFYKQWWLLIGPPMGSDSRTCDYEVAQRSKFWPMDIMKIIEVNLALCFWNLKFEKILKDWLAEGKDTRRHTKRNRGKRQKIPLIMG